MRIDLIGYLQMAIGLAGIVVTLLASPPILDGFYRIRAGEGLPEHFGGLVGGVRVFCVVFVLVVFAFLIVLGLSLALADVARTMGAERPVLTAVLIVVSLGFAAAATTLALYRLKATVPVAVATAAVIGLSVIEALNSDPVVGWGALSAGVLAIILSGVLVRHGF